MGMENLPPTGIWSLYCLACSELLYLLCFLVHSYLPQTKKPIYATASTQYYFLLSEMQRFYGHSLSGMSFYNATSGTWLIKYLLLIVGHKTSGQNHLGVRQNSSYVYDIHILVWLVLKQRSDMSQNKTYPTPAACPSFNTGQAVPFPLKHI